LLGRCLGAVIRLGERRCRNQSGTCEQHRGCSHRRSHLYSSAGVAGLNYLEMRAGQ
jgi:hypothetical protein